MSPAILSRFEKHELRPSHLLNEVGRNWLDSIESHPVWLDVSESIGRQKLLYGYHEETFASLALHLQDRGIPMELDRVDEDDIDPNSSFAMLMRAANPMAMIKLERDSSIHPELLDVCRLYRLNFVLEGIDDALNKIKSDRMVVMTNTLRHLEVMSESSIHRHFIIQLFDVQTELELHRLLDSVKPEDLADPDFCLIIQYDAATGPIEQFQLTKYEVAQQTNITFHSLNSSSHLPKNLCQHLFAKCPSIHSSHFCLKCLARSCKLPYRVFVLVWVNSSTEYEQP